jgi:hypothetical protein
MAFTRFGITRVLKHALALINRMIDHIARLPLESENIGKSD